MQIGTGKSQVVLLQARILNSLNTRFSNLPEFQMHLEDFSKGENKKARLI